MSTWSRFFSLPLPAPLLWLPTLAILLVTWGAVTHAPERPLKIALGNEEGLNDHNEAKHLYSFLGWGGPETAGGLLARRGGAVARFAIPWAFRGGSPLRVEFVMSGWGMNSPVQVRANDLVVKLPAQQSGWRRYQLLVSPDAAIYERDLYMEWQSDGERGPLLHQVVLHTNTKQEPLFVWLWPAGAIVVIGILGRKQQTMSLLLWVVVLCLSTAAGRLLYEPQLLPWDALAALGAGAAVLITMLSPDLRLRLALWAMVVWLLAAPQVLGTWLLDDAFISFRYAKNLVAGSGFTFNPGGEVVEGYTNFLWTIIIAGGMAVGYEPVLLAQLLCTALSIGTLLLCYWIAATWWDGRGWCLLPPLLLALNPAFLLYTARGSGMETALVAFLVLLALWRTWQTKDGRTGVLAGMACALLMMARPDGALVPLSGIIVLVMKSIVPSQPRWSWHVLAAFIAGLLLLYAPYFAWRWSYYGYLLPNTFYAKVGATLPQVVRGVRYAGECAMEQGGVFVVPLLAASALALWKQKGRFAAPALLLWLFVCITLLYIVAVGGDQFPYGRFVIPIVPPLALLLTHGAASLWSYPQTGLSPSPVQRGIRAGTLLVVVLLAGSHIVLLPATDSRSPDTQVWAQNKVALKNIDLGLWLRLNTPPDAVVATGIAGALPYYAERTTIDMLGLNDLHIAHLDVETMGQGIAGTEKSDPSYILSRQPDYIPWTTAGMLRGEQRFEREYHLITVMGPRGGSLKFYTRRNEQ